DPCCLHFFGPPSPRGRGMRYPWLPFCVKYGSFPSAVCTWAQSATGYRERQKEERTALTGSAPRAAGGKGSAAENARLPAGGDGRRVLCHLLQDRFNKSEHLRMAHVADSQLDLRSPRLHDADAIAVTAAEGEGHVP